VVKKVCVDECKKARYEAKKGKSQHASGLIFFLNWGPLSDIKVHSVLDLHVERTGSVLRWQRTVTGDAYCRWESCNHAASFQAWMTCPHNSWKHGGFIFQTDMTKQFKLFALFSKIIDINISMSCQKWNIKYSNFFLG